MKESEGKKERNERKYEMKWEKWNKRMRWSLQSSCKIHDSNFKLQERIDDNREREFFPMHK